MREKSSTSLITLSSARPDDLTITMNSRCRDVRSVSSTRSVMPRMPFIGVRISWLMLATNSLLARLAAMAASFARSSSDSARRRSVMSRM